MAKNDDEKLKSLSPHTEWVELSSLSPNFDHDFSMLFTGFEQYTKMCFHGARLVNIWKKKYMEYICCLIYQERYFESFSVYMFCFKNVDEILFFFRV